MTDGYRMRSARRPIHEPEQMALLQDPQVRERFYAKVSPEPNSGCHLWAGSIRTRGHGQFYLRGARGGALIGAHRLAWMLERGELKSTDFVCHRCDLPYCVNPDHLFLGSQRDNMHDCVTKGRFGNRAGERHYHVLTDAAVLEIRRSQEPASVFARRFGVSKTCINAARSGVTWAHLPGVVRRTAGGEAV